MTTTPYPRGTNWYARIRWYEDNVRREKTVALKTKDRRVALKRLYEVESFESDIIHGKQPVFSWETSKRPITDLSSAVSEYLIYLKNNGAKQTTIERAQLCMNNVMKSIGSTYPIKAINADKIENIKQYFRGGLSDTGINMILSRLRGLLNWCKDIKEIIPNTPKIRFIKVPKKIPAYLTEQNLNDIMELNTLDQHHKDAFRMYQETGMRLREPFKGKIEGNWLIISSDDSKTGLYGEICLKEDHKRIITDMQERVNKSRSSFTYETGKYSKMFKKVVRSIGREDLHFHNLRDTFAVMRYLETRDIYQVSKELGHTSVKITEKYALFSLRKLSQDFPLLSENYLHRDNSVDAMGAKMGVKRERQNQFIESAMA